MADFLIAYHFPANTGFAIEPLEIAFFEAVSGFLRDGERIHLGYPAYTEGKPRWLVGRNVPLVELDYRNLSHDQGNRLTAYLKKNEIRYVLAFDLPVGADICRVFRLAGVQSVLSYWGAPMSSVNSGLKLLAKRMEVVFTRAKPHHFIFESYGMQRAATHGRGVAKCNTSVVRLGIDIEKFASCSDYSYVYQQFSIPPSRRVMFYAGHMEERKGVHIIVKSAVELVNRRGVSEAHFLICGNREGEEAVFEPLYKGTRAEGFITFAGYRDDIPRLMPGCYAGIIASTGWDSFPRSSLEMSAAGLPLMVSNMLGLNETVEDGRTGFLFKTGDYHQLADRIQHLLGNPKERDTLSRHAVERVKRGFTLEDQGKT